MCGIAGILNLDGRLAEHEPLRRMLGPLAHRGPDDEGIVVDGAMGLAHRRLAIIDLSAAAHQPMTRPDGREWLVFNGEIYNFRELRAQYADVAFRSESDTEVVLAAYRREGIDCVRRFNGIFAFGLWDGEAQRLLLARDRFGAKPLYYRIEGERLIFASEIKAILAVMDGSPRVCLAALQDYFTFQNVFTDLTLFEGIRILPAGHVLVADSGRVDVRPYWDLVLAGDESDGARWEEELRATFETSVVRQLVSDVPVGCYLSGGMDSASVVAVASRRIPRLTTFTGGFDLSSALGLELGFDERADAEIVASHFGTEHYEMIVHAGDMAWVLPRLVWHLEDLRAGMSYQNFFIARLASKFVRVVLSGVGGDEMFAGYPWRYEAVLGVRDDDAFEDAYYALWCRLVPDRARADFFTPDVVRAVDAAAPRETLRAVLAPTKGWSPLDKALYFDSKTFLHALLVVEDKLAMAHGLEARVPFLDNELVGLVSRIPGRLKLANRQGKAVFRQAMAGLLPTAIVAKPKQGFTPPDQSWYRGPSMQYMQDVLLAPRTLARGYVQPAAVKRVVDDHLAGRVNNRLLLWSLLCFEWWCRIFLDGERPATA